MMPDRLGMSSDDKKTSPAPKSSRPGAAVPAAGLIDEVNVPIVPLLLGAGERLFDRLGRAAPRLEQVRVVEAPGVTPVTYRVIR